jgi:outer membrane protein assembly factor BamB
VHSRIVATLAVLVVAALAAPPVATAGQSGAFQVNPAHTGEAFGETFAPPLHKRWVQSIGEAIWYPLIGDGRIFAFSGVTNQVPQLHAFDQATGRIIWSKPAQRTRIAYDGGRLFTLDADGRLAALDPRDAREIWSTQLTGMSHYDDDPTAVGGVVYVVGASPGNKVYAVSQSDGRLLWAADFPHGGSDSSPAVAGGLVYVSWAGPQAYALEAGTGAVRWHHSGPTTGGGGVTPVVSAGRVFVRDTGNSGAGYVLDSATGRHLGSWTALAPPSVANGIALYPTEQGVVARGLDDGATRWTAPFNSQSAIPPVIVNGVAYLADPAGVLSARRLSSGEVLWSEKISDSYIRMAAAGEGLLAVPTGNSLVLYEGTRTASSQPGPTENAPGAGAGLRVRALRRVSISRLRRRGLRVTVAGGAPGARVSVSLTVGRHGLARVRRTFTGAAAAVRLRPRARALSRVRHGDRLTVRAVQVDSGGRRTAATRTVVVAR